jgi:hypothetical protein
MNCHPERSEGPAFFTSAAAVAGFKRLLVARS